MNYPAVQLWKNLGLTTVLCEKQAKLTEHLSTCFPYAECVVNNTQAMLETQQALKKIHFLQEKNKISQVILEENTPKVHQQENTETTSVQHEAHLASNSSKAFSVCMEEWHPLLRSYAEKLKPVSILWTYHELAQDLFEEPSQQRRTSLRYLLEGLKLPQGSNAFFPCSLPNTLAPAKKEFTQALHLMNPKIIFAFGTQTIAQFIPVENPPIWQEFVFYKYTRILFLPPLNELVSQESLLPCLRFLQTYTHSIHIL